MVEWIVCNNPNLLVGDGFLHVPKHYLFNNINSANKPLQTIHAIINSERSDLQLHTPLFTLQTVKISVDLNRFAMYNVKYIIEF